MDSLSAAPVFYSSLDADEFDDLTADEDEGEYDEEQIAVDESNLSLKERYVKHRFDAWFQQQVGDARRELIQELYNRLEVCSRRQELNSSVLTLNLEFVLSGMRGSYQQQSCTDFNAPTWDLSLDGELRPVPNVSTNLTLDEESLISSTFYAGVDQNSGNRASSSSIEEVRLSERFGSNTLEKLGGLSGLLQFLGVVCADAQASCYAAKLPFGGLSQAIIGLGTSGSNHQRILDVSSAQPDGPFKPTARTKPALTSAQATLQSQVKAKPKASRGSSQTRKI